MEATISICVRAKLPAFSVHLPGVGQIGLQRLSVVVRVDEVVAGVVGRVDVDHLDLAQIRLLQQLQYFQIVALDDEIFRGIEVDTSAGAGRSVPRLGA